MSVDVARLQKKLEEVHGHQQQIIAQRNQAEARISECDVQLYNLAGRAAALRELIEETEPDTVNAEPAEGNV